MSSSVVPVTSDVSHGTVLRRLLFPFFVNDLSESITSSAKLFADGCLDYSTILFTNNAIQLQEDLDQPGLLVNAWKMNLSPH